MRHRIFLHVVWTARDRAPLIDVGLAQFLERFLPAVARQERATVLGLGIVQTHLHLAVRIEPTTSLPRLVQRWKGGASVMAEREGIAGSGRLRWAKGYNAQSVSPQALDRVIEYVSTQAQRHPEDAILNWSPRRLRAFDAATGRPSHA